ncbi:MAG: translation elongation factor Ts [Planctomycetales bacterium]
MTKITAQAVKSLRDRTQLPMMECKKALVENDGDEEKAIEALRKQGKSKMTGREDRETGEGYVAVHADIPGSVGAMVEFRCESGPVAGNEEFRQLANDLAKQLATGPGAATAEELLAQDSPSKDGMTLQQQFDDLNNRLRETFKVARLVRIDSPCGGYAHHTGTDGVLLETNGGEQQAANEIAMHVAAMKPTVVATDDLDQEKVEKERGILMEAARQEGKPENILAKMVEGRMRVYYEENVLLEQKFIKDEKGKTPVKKVAKDAGMEIASFLHWKLGKADSPEG